MGAVDPEFQQDRAAFLASLGTSVGFRNALAIASRELEGRPYYLTRARLLGVRADALYGVGQRAAAFEAYRSLSTTVAGITSPETWQRYAELALSRADRATARRAFEKALDIGQPYPLSRRAAARVRALEPP
jgi:hypothetical protein